MNKLLTQVNLNAIQQSGLPGAKFGPGNTTIGGIIASILPWIFTIAGMLLLIYLIFGGLQLMLSGGDPKGAQAAKAHITNALIGFIIIFAAFWIVQLVGLIFGLQGITTIFR